MCRAGLEDDKEEMNKRYTDAGLEQWLPQKCEDPIPVPSFPIKADVVAVAVIQKLVSRLGKTRRSGNRLSTPKTGPF